LQRYPSWANSDDLPLHAPRRLLGRPGPVELLTGIEGVSSRAVRKIALIDG
jgi:hypothetical protein